MRILAFTSLFPNSVQPWHGIFVQRRLAALACRPGYRIRLIAPVPYAPHATRVQRWAEASQIPAEEQIENIHVYHPRYFLIPKVSMPFHGLLMFAGTIALARHLHKQETFDFIDAHYVYPDGFAAVLLGKWLRIPVVVSARGTDLSHFPSFPLIRPMIRWTISQAASVVAVSNSLRDAALKLGADSNKVVTVGNGIDVTRFHPIERSRARQTLGVPQNARIVLSVGNLVLEKGHENLIRAFARIAKTNSDMSLYLVGDGYLRSQLASIAQKEAVGDRIHLVGRRPNDELKHWYSAADVSCLVSSREGWANVLLESLACGTPVVATRVGGTPEVISSDELGVLVEQDIDSIARGFEAALQKKWNREKLVGYAASRNWDVVSEELARFLEARIRPSESTSESVAALKSVQG